VIAKLRGRSATELRDRLLQASRATAERYGMLPTVSMPLELEMNPQTPWRTASDDELRARLSDAEKRRLLARADRVVQRRFDVLGLEGVSYGEPVDWQLDPLSGRRAPMVHWSRVPYLDADRVGDHKVIWEVNRHQWLLWLGQAWRLTQDEQYPTAAAELLRAWLTANPPKRGINWCSALEAAFRVQSWVYGVHLLRDASPLDAALRRALVQSAALHADHIERNISTWFAPNTHLTGEALALLTVGTAWPDVPKSGHWRALGWEILCRELPRQVRPDGVYFEQSAWYQAYTLDFYVLGMAWAGFARLPIPTGMGSTVRDAARALHAVTRPDGSLVMFGDDDGGRTLPFSASGPGQVSDSLWRASDALGDASLAPRTDDGRSTLLWLEGTQAYERATRAAGGSLTDDTQVFPTGGWVCLRDLAASSGREHSLVFDGGPHGGGKSCAHSHADALTFDLSLHGVPVFVDPGTYMYVGEPRRRYRSTAVHNTVTVDGLDSSEQGSPFSWTSVADGVLNGVGNQPRARWVTAFHDGYARLPDPVRHSRTIIRFCRDYWLMFDTLSGAAPHAVQLTFQTAPAAAVTQRSSSGVRVDSGDVTLILGLDPRLTLRTETGAVSHAYAHSVAATRIVATARIEGATTFCSAFGALDECGELDVSYEPASDWWQVASGSRTDRVTQPLGRTVQFADVSFDGTALAVLDCDADATVLAFGAGTLQLAESVHHLAASDLLVARRGSDGCWMLEN
jgi:hypothetical protein